MYTTRIPVVDYEYVHLQVASKNVLKEKCRKIIHKKKGIKMHSRFSVHFFSEIKIETILLESGSQKSIYKCYTEINYLLFLF
jgi:hypothetical protein